MSSMVVHVGDKWLVKSESGEVLGEHDTEESALKQLAAIEASKHRKDAVTTSVTVRRFDAGELKKSETLHNGYVRADAFISRQGLLEYARADGSKWVEYRPADEAFTVDHIDSFDSAPLTLEHPPGGFLDADNTKMYQVGTVSKVRRDGDMVRAQLLLTDSLAVEAAKRGKQEISCGYTCDLDMTPGEIYGKRYDAIQRNIRGNHVAIVAAGRAGASVRLRVDSLDSESTERTPMKKVNIDGVDFEVSEPAAQAVEKIQKESATMAEQLKAAVVTEAKADALAKEVESLKAELAAAPEKMKAVFAARAALEAKALEVCGEVKADSSDEMLKCAIIEKALKVQAAGKPAEYIAAAYEIAIAQEVNAPVAEPVKTAKIDSVESPETARERFYAASRAAHKPTK